MFLAGAHGWNIDIDADRIVPTRVRPGLPGKESVGSGWLVCCTLLGPEGPEPDKGNLGWDCTLWTFSCWQNLLVVGGVGTARTLRTTQWTRAS